MNWLSQMIVTPIDMEKMYPAERTTQQKISSSENLKVANEVRSSRARIRYLEAMGNKRMTAEQIRMKLGGEVAEAHTVRRMMSRLLKDGIVVRIGEPNGKNILWEVAKD